jgi:hypothetical protein
MAYLRSPNGTAIEGTLEGVKGKALVEAPYSRRPDGTFDFEWVGETKIWWDEQRTIERDGKRVFVDETGDEFTEDQLELVEGNASEPE